MTPSDQEAAKELESRFKSTFETDSGLIVLQHLCLQFGIGERLSIPDANKAVDPHRAAIREGEQAVVFHILKLVAKANGRSFLTIPVKP